MFRDPSLVRAVITSEKCTRLVAWDIGRKDKLFQAETESETELIEQFDGLLSMMAGPFRVEAWRKGDEPDSGGRPSDKRRPFVWQVIGTANAKEPAAPVPHAAPSAPVVHGRTETEFQQAVELERLKLEIELLRQRTLHDDDDDQDDEPQRNPWAFDRETIAELRGLLRDINSPAPPVFPNKGTPAETMTGGPGPVSGDPETLALLDEMARQHPEGYRAYLEQLRAQYGKG